MKRHIFLLICCILFFGCNRPQPVGQSELSTAINTDEINTPLAATVEEKSVPSAKLELSEERYDFGEMNPYEFGHRLVTFKNVGQAPLQLDVGESTCACTIAKFPQQPIPPGESAEVRIEWQTKKNNQRFSERVAFTTNDPSQPEVGIWIEGFVRVHFGADPPGFSIPTAHPGVAEKASSIISSQVWKDFKVVKVESSLSEIQSNIEPAQEYALEKYKVKAAYNVTVTLPDTMPQGPFKHWVSLTIDPGDGSEFVNYQLPLEGKVARRVAVYGPHIDNTGLIKFGLIPTAKGASQRYVVKVRDKDRDLVLKEIKTEPEFVDVKLTPWSGVKEGLGLYHLDLTIPKNQRICDYIAARKGSLKIEFDHPRIDSLDLSLSFAIIDGIAKR